MDDLIIFSVPYFGEYGNIELHFSSILKKYQKELVCLTDVPSLKITPSKLFSTLDVLKSLEQRFERAYRSAKEQLSTYSVLVNKSCAEKVETIESIAAKLSEFAGMNETLCDRFEKRICKIEDFVKRARKEFKQYDGIDVSPDINISKEAEIATDKLRTKFFLTTKEQRAKVLTETESLEGILDASVIQAVNDTRFVVRVVYFVNEQDTINKWIARKELVEYKNKSSEVTELVNRMKDRHDELSITNSKCYRLGIEIAALISIVESVLTYGPRLSYSLILCKIDPEKTDSVEKRLKNYISSWVSKNSKEDVYSGDDYVIEVFRLSKIC